MKKRFSILAALTVAVAGFLALTAASPSFAASQANKAGVTLGLTGQYLAIGEYSQNQAQAFMNDGSTPSQNTFQAFLQRLRLNTSVSYDQLAHGMPLAAIFVQMDLTNAYNGITDGYGTNGYYMLGGSPAPTGFNNDFNTFGLRQAYIRVITPVGAIMFGRMPVKFGLGVAVNTNADGLGDFMPLGNIGIFAGTLFGSEVSAYSTGSPCSTSALGTALPSSNCALSGTTEGFYPPAAEGYTHIQMGTIPTIEVMTMKPVNDVSYSAWLTEAHLNQFEAGLSSVNTAYTGQTTGYTTASSVGSIQPTANITFGGLSAKYAANGTKLGVEADYFRGSLVDSSQAIDAGFTVPEMLYGAVGFNGTGAATNFNLGYYNGINDQNVNINSYDLYLTASQVLGTSTPMSLGFKFGIGAPVATDNYNFTYYSTVQNTRTLFGDVIGSSWQPIQFNSPGISYIYGGAAGEAVGPNLANKYVLMVDASQYLPSNNTLKESLIHAAWLTTSISDPLSPTGNLELFGGSNIGTEFDLNFTHHFTKTLAFQAWASYVWTGAGVESATSVTTPTIGNLPPSMGSVPITAQYSSFSNAQTKNITAIGTDFSWNF